MKFLNLILLFFLLPLSGFTQTCEGSHSSSQDDSWLSCEETENPNPERSQGHWILYDLGDIKSLKESHFWNYNVSGETDRGVATIAVDMSLDGESWWWWGDINLEEAPGVDNYFGEVGPDFYPTNARYILLNIISNHGGNCYGFSEMRLEFNHFVTEIEELLVEDTGFSLHPNPTTESSTIYLEHFQGSTINVFNPMGKLVMIVEPTSSSTALYFSDLAVGVYTIEVLDELGVRKSKKLTLVN
jgi:hypothetical protein